MTAGAALALLFLRVPALEASVTLKEIRWEIAIQGSGQKRVYHEIRNWFQPPNALLKQWPRAEVILTNDGPQPQEAMLMRYAVAVRLVKIQGESKKEAVWSIPFILEDKRIPKIRAQETRIIPIYLNRVVLQSYLKRVHRAGFWPEALRIHVVLEPRAGETFKDRILESILPISWKP
jgi:hypothetical protein